MFSTLRQGSVFYVLEKGEDPKLRVASVDSVTTPQPKYPSSFQTPYSPSLEMVIDVRAKEGEEVLEFKQLPASLSIANYNNSSVVVSDSRDAMNAEVEAMQRTSKDILASIGMHQKVVERCEEFFKVLNPQYAKQKAQEEQIGKLENKMVGIEDALQNIQGMLSSVLTKKKGD